MVTLEVRFDANAFCRVFFRLALWLLRQEQFKAVISTNQTEKSFIKGEKNAI